MAALRGYFLHRDFRQFWHYRAYNKYNFFGILPQNTTRFFLQSQQELSSTAVKKKPSMKSMARLLAGIICLCLLSSFEAPPKIVNIVNFIRLLEPRDAAITEEVLYQTVVKQVNIMKKYRLGGTFLLQYDALMDSRYQHLLKGLARDSFEIGGWWEIPQPLVEKAGMQWRGAYCGVV